jgi:hypothetical protein
MFYIPVNIDVRCMLPSEREVIKNAKKPVYNCFS